MMQIAKSPTAGKVSYHLVALMQDSRSWAKILARARRIVSAGYGFEAIRSISGRTPLISAKD